jgi:hypothetical protein
MFRFDGDVFRLGTAMAETPWGPGPNPSVAHLKRCAQPSGGAGKNKARSEQESAAGFKPQKPGISLV